MTTNLTEHLAKRIRAILGPRNDDSAKLTDLIDRMCCENDQLRAENERLLAKANGLRRLADWRLDLVQEVMTEREVLMTQIAKMDGSGVEIADHIFRLANERAAAIAQVDQLQAELGRDVDELREVIARFMEKHAAQEQAK